jgi:hypothetical protein
MTDADHVDILAVKYSVSDLVFEGLLLSMPKHCPLVQMSI